MTDAEVRTLVGKYASELAEHFDSVRIFVTWPNPDDCQKTQSFEEGRGNLYAQLGQVHEWLAMQDEYQRRYAAKKDAEEP